jgi:hypothetical protein
MDERPMLFRTRIENKHEPCRARVRLHRRPKFKTIPRTSRRVYRPRGVRSQRRCIDADHGPHDMTKGAFRSIVEEILLVDPGSLRDTDTRAAVEHWTSLADVQIMTVMASDLGLEADAELLEYETIGELLDLLEQRGAFAT